MFSKNLVGLIVMIIKTVLPGGLLVFPVESFVIKQLSDASG